MLRFIQAIWRRRRRPRISPACVATAIIFAHIICILFLALLEGHTQTGEVIDSGANASGIIFLGHTYKIDLVELNVEILWQIIGCGDGYLEADTYVFGSKNCGTLSRAIDVYVDGSVEPYYLYNNTQQPRQNGSTPVFVQACNEFKTTQKLDNKDGFIGITTSPIKLFYDGHFDFPLDVWYHGTVFMALDHSTGEPLPILRLAPVDFADDFLPYIITEIQTVSNNGTSDLPSRVVKTKFRRTGLSIAFNFIIMAVNWLLTIAVLFSCLVAFRLKQSTMPESLLLLPITVILTIPALRVLMIGSPTFGVLIDALGLFPQMIIVSMCAVFILMRISLKLNKSVQDAKGSLNTTSESFNMTSESVMVKEL